MFNKGHKAQGARELRDGRDERSGETGKREIRGQKTEDRISNVELRISKLKTGSLSLYDLNVFAEGERLSDLNGWNY